MNSLQNGLTHTTISNAFEMPPVKSNLKLIFLVLGLLKQGIISHLIHGFLIFQFRSLFSFFLYEGIISFYTHTHTHTHTQKHKEN